MFWAVPIAVIISVGVYLSIVGWARERRLEREAFYEHETTKRMLEKENLSASDALAWTSQRTAIKAKLRRDSISLSAYLLVGLGIGMLGGLQYLNERRPYWMLGFIPICAGIALAIYVVRMKDSKTS